VAQFLLEISDFAAVRKFFFPLLTQFILYIYIYMCVCVCVCVYRYLQLRNFTKKRGQNMKKLRTDDVLNTSRIKRTHFYE
jgi:hypothetical protein